MKYKVTVEAEIEVDEDKAVETLQRLDRWGNFEDEVETLIEEQFLPDDSFLGSVITIKKIETFIGRMDE